MKRVATGLLIGSLVLGGMALPAEAGGWHHRHHDGHHRHHIHHHDHHFHHHGHAHFLGGFLAGATTVLVLDALLTPRVVYEPVYYRAPVCQDVWVAGRWELHPRVQNGFTTYYHIWVPGYWQRQCY